MPRQATTSRSELCDVVIGLIDQQGLDGLSIRAVAGAAGVAIGTVQHYFATKDALLLAAYERIEELARARLTAALADQASPRGRLRALLEQLLPLDQERRAEVGVALAFSARSVHAPALADRYAAGQGELHQVLEQLVREVVGEHGTSATDVSHEAVTLAALADGLAWHVLTAPESCTPEAAQVAIDQALDRIPAAEPSG